MLEIQLVIEDDETGDTIAEIGGIDIEALRNEAKGNPAGIAAVITHQIDAAREAEVRPDGPETDRGGLIGQQPY